MKRLIVFDLDGTLAESKAVVDAEMSALLVELLKRVKVAVISSGDWSQLQSQLLATLAEDALLQNLSLLPTGGTQFYQYASEWEQRSADDFSNDEKEDITGLQTEAGADQGEATSIEVNKTAIDKNFGIQQLREHLAIELDEMHFYGDVQQAGVTSTQVANPEETKRAIEALIESMNFDQPNHFARR